MERRVTSHTEEEEMNQRRRLLGLARKGDEKAINKLFELYQVKIYTGDSLKKSSLSLIKSLTSTKPASKKPIPAAIQKRTLPKIKANKTVKVEKSKPPSKKPKTTRHSKIKAKPKVKPKVNIKSLGKKKTNLKSKGKAKPKKGK